MSAFSTLVKNADTLENARKTRKNDKIKKFSHVLDKGHVMKYDHVVASCVCQSLAKLCARYKIYN